jgi:gamma-glutamyltranspeptidase/glutathione hydrolase
VVGERFVQADLARSIQLMADAETAATGDRKAGLEAARSVFYDGELAELIVSYHRENGGYLVREDLAEFRCRYEPVLTTGWRDFDVLTCGPWSQGPMLAQTLQTLEAAGLDGLEHNGADYIHLVVEALKGAFADREHHYGDPAFVEVDIERLLSPEHAAARVAGIDPRQAAPQLPPALFGTSQDLPEPLTTRIFRPLARAGPRTCAWSIAGATRSPPPPRTVPPPHR